MLKTKLFVVVNVDWFFLSHRLPIALAAKEDGYDVTIVSYDTGRSSEIRSYGFNFIGAPFTRSGTNVFDELLLIRFLRKLYKLHRPDIVHHVTLKPSIYGSIAAKQAGIKNVVNAISGLGYNFTAGRKGIKQYLLNLLLKKGFSNDQLQFIFQNPDDINLFKKLGLVKYDNQVNIIKGSGVDLKSFNFSLEPDENKVKVLLPARMLYDKGVVELIKAAENLKETYRDKVCFNLAGDIDEHNPASISKTDLSVLLDPPYINWIGFKKDIARVLSEHHIIVLPSYREGLPKSLIEACAIGRPIITTDAPGCKECVIENYNGFLVPVKDHILLAQKISTLIDDESLRITMGQNSRRLAEENFSIESVVDKTLILYANMLGKVGANRLLKN
jgi:glycosyltransferase involved in cell wall biosynthesis